MSSKAKVWSPSSHPFTNICKSMTALNKRESSGSLDSLHMWNTLEKKDSAAMAASLLAKAPSITFLPWVFPLSCSKSWNLRRRVLKLLFSSSQWSCSLNMMAISTIWTSILARWPLKRITPANFSPLLKNTMKRLKSPLQPKAIMTMESEWSDYGRKGPIGHSKTPSLESYLVR